MQKNVLNNKIFSYNLEFYINFILKILRCDIMDNKTGILLLSHGSKLIDGAQGLCHFVSWDFIFFIHPFFLLKIWLNMPCSVLNLFFSDLGSVA